MGIEWDSVWQAFHPGPGFTKGSVHGQKSLVALVTILWGGGEGGGNKALRGRGIKLWASGESFMYLHSRIFYARH